MSKTLDNMTPKERSLLLYFECCAVDYSGRVNVQHMNDDDLLIADGWDEEGFVQFGRIVSRDHNRQGQHWVELSDEAWRLAHQERIARFRRNERRYARTSDDLG